MPAELSTTNPQGLGFQSGWFSGPQGEPLKMQFFNAAFAGRLNENPIFREAYHCNIVQECGISQWLEQFMGYDTECLLDANNGYSIIETYGEYSQIKISADATVPTYPGTVVLHLDPNSHFVGGAFILPQVGNTIVTSPNGVLVEVTAVSVASADDSTVTVRLRDKTGNTGTQAIKEGDELLVLSGSEIADCACPTGQFKVPDMPIITDVRMVDIGDKGEVCGDAALKCHWMMIPFYDECGNEYKLWYTEALQKMYRDHEKRKRYEKLLNPYFGIIPTVVARGIKWTPASDTELDPDDVRDFKAELDINGIGCKEFAIFAGREKFSQFQRMLLAAGVEKLDNSIQPLRDCKWIDMNYCGISVEGLTLHIYEECSFSNGKELGSQNMVFPNSAIIVPMCNRPACNRSNGRGDAGARDNKMASTVYFKDVTGKVWDNVTDSNGMFGPRNTFGAGCKQHEWTIESRFLQEIHCANYWGFMGLY